MILSEGNNLYKNSIYEPIQEEITNFINNSDLMEFSQSFNEISIFQRNDPNNIISRKQTQEKLILNSECLNNFKLFIDCLKINEKYLNSKKIQEVLNEIKIKDTNSINFQDFNTFYADYEQYLLNYFHRKRNRNKNWSSLSLKLFIWIVIFVCEIDNVCPKELNDEKWLYISNFFPYSNAAKFKFKWFSIQKSQTLIHDWTKEEDDFLIKIIENEKIIKWTTIAKKLNNETNFQNIRLSKHCRERWNNYLNPDLKKGEWKQEEDLKILEIVLNHGKRWSMISKELKCRNEHSVKNRFYTLVELSKPKRSKNKISLLDLNNIIRSKIDIINKSNKNNNILSHDKYSISNISSLSNINISKKIKFAIESQHHKNLLNAVKTECFEFQTIEENEDIINNIPIYDANINAYPLIERTNSKNNIKSYQIQYNIEQQSNNNSEKIIVNFDEEQLLAESLSHLDIYEFDDLSSFNHSNIHCSIKNHMSPLINKSSKESILSRSPKKMATTSNFGQYKINSNASVGKKESNSIVLSGNSINSSFKIFQRDL